MAIDQKNEEDVEADRKKSELEELHARMIEEIADVAIILLDKDGTILS